MKKTILFLDRWLGRAVDAYHRFWMWRGWDRFPFWCGALPLFLVSLVVFIPMGLAFIGVNEWRRRVDADEFWERTERLAAMEPETFSSSDHPEIN